MLRVTRARLFEWQSLSPPGRTQCDHASHCVSLGPLAVCVARTRCVSLGPLHFARLPHDPHAMESLEANTPNIRYSDRLLAIEDPPRRAWTGARATSPHGWCITEAPNRHRSDDNVPSCGDLEMMRFWSGRPSAASTREATSPVFYGLLSSCAAPGRRACPPRASEKDSARNQRRH